VPVDEKNTVEMILCYSGSVEGRGGGTRFLVALPQTIADKQKILSIKYTPEPSRKLEHNGNSYAEFVFDHRQKQFSVLVNVKAELYRYDLSTAKTKGEKDRPKADELEQFLKQEKFIDKDDAEIQKAARSISGRTETEIVTKIYDYVIDSLEYQIHEEEDLGAAKALKKKKGDCCEYSDLFVALCRAKNIPARFITGYTERFDKVSPKHHWVEVYLKRYGWVPFDPSWGDVEFDRIRSINFEYMKPVYLYLSNLRRDPALFNNHFYAYTFYSKGVTLEDTVRFVRQDKDNLARAPK
jgi:transglutaminase-like putative cysteine protease